MFYPNILFFKTQKSYEIDVEKQARSDLAFFLQGKIKTLVARIDGWRDGVYEFPYFSLNLGLKPSEAIGFDPRALSAIWVANKWLDVNLREFFPFDSFPNKVARDRHFLPEEWLSPFRNVVYDIACYKFLLSKGFFLSQGEGWTYGEISRALAKAERKLNVLLERFSSGSMIRALAPSFKKKDVGLFLTDCVLARPRLWENEISKRVVDLPFALILPNLKEGFLSRNLKGIDQQLLSDLRDIMRISCELVFDFLGWQSLRVWNYWVHQYEIERRVFDLGKEGFLLLGGKDMESLSERIGDEFGFVLSRYFSFYFSSKRYLQAQRTVRDFCSSIVR